MCSFSLVELSSPFKLGSLYECSLSFSYSLFRSNCPTLSIYSFFLFIAWGWWGAYDYLLVSLVWVGLDLIILDKEYASLETVVMALELVLAFKRLLGSDIPKGNTELPRSRVALSKYSSRPIHTWSALAYLTCDQWNKQTIGFGLKKVLGVCLGQGPRPNGPKVICRTMVILKS